MVVQFDYGLYTQASPKSLKTILHQKIFYFRFKFTDSKQRHLLYASNIKFYHKSWSTSTEKMFNANNNSVNYTEKNKHLTTFKKQQQKCCNLFSSNHSHTATAKAGIMTTNISSSITHSPVGKYSFNLTLIKKNSPHHA